MYDSEPVSNLVESICYEVDNYIDYLNAEDKDETFPFERDDAIVIFEREGQLLYKIEHFKNHLHIDMGESVISTLDRLITNNEHDYDKIWELVNALAGRGIPYEVIACAEELSKEYYYSPYTIDLHHNSLDGALYYECNIYDEAISYIIKFLNKHVNVYKNIQPFSHSYIPNEVFDFLYQNSNEYTHIRYLGMNKEECIFYPCHEDTLLVDGYVQPVSVLVGYDEHTKKCRLITGELASRIYCKLERLDD